MKHYVRGSKIVIEAGPFKNSSGDIAYPSSVHLTIAYPYGSTGRWPHDGSELVTTSGISMTTPSTVSTATAVGVWRTTWNSGVSAKGIVYYSAVPSTDGLLYGVEEGKFELRGGLASSRAVASTLG